MYPFSREPVGGEPTFEGPLSCRVSPQGDLYIGNIRDSGWGAGSNTGSIVRLRYRGQPAPGIAEVRAAHDGFTIEFTTPVDRTAAANPVSYSIVVVSSHFHARPTAAKTSTVVPRRSLPCKWPTMRSSVDAHARRAARGIRL